MERVYFIQHRGKKILFNSLLKLTGRKLTLFDTAEQAKDWLAEQ